MRSLDPRARGRGAPGAARPPTCRPTTPMVLALLDAAGRYEPSATSVGRDGASDAVAFLEVGVPAVEFGPRGAGHHGPEEYVEIDSLPRYRRALVDSPTCRRSGPRPARASRGRGAREPRRPRRSRRTGEAAATGACSPAAAAGALWLAIAGWTPLGAIIGLVVAVGGGRLHLPRRHPGAAAPNTRRGAGGARGHPARPPRRAHEHPADRLRPRGRRGGPGPQRLADPRAHGQPPRVHLDALLPARPLRDDPRRGDGQDQRGVLPRPGEDDPDRRGAHRRAHQLLREHRLHRLRASS